MTKEEKEQKRLEQEQKMIAEKNLENAQKISATSLGKIAVNLTYCETEEEKQQILRVESRKHKTSVEALSEVVAPYKDKVKETGKLDTRKLHLEKTQSVAFVNCQYDNALLSLDIDTIPSEKLVAFVKGMKQVKTELVNLLHSSDGTTSNTQGYCYFTHSPLKNLFTDEEIETPEFYLVSTGWDGKRSYPYYGVRMTPSDNPKNTRDIQYQRPVPVEIV